MDYSYFSAAHQPYPFMGGGPTLEAHANARTDDNFNDASPQEFDVDHTFSTLESFAPRYDTPGLADPQSPKSVQRPSLAATAADSGISVEGDDQPQRSSSEEKDSMTPAQSRRKAQNRAAQRAFRERKERHVKDLEQKLSKMERNSSTLAADNDRLKRELQKIATENEILRAKSASAQPAGLHPDTVVGPMTFTPTDFYSSVLKSHDNKTPSHRIVVSEATGERLLAAGAAWDVIQEHDLVKRGLVDIGDVCERLKKVAKCDGQGPVFEERDITQAIEASAASGSDELI